MVEIVNERLSNLSINEVPNPACSLSNFNFDQCRCNRLVDQSLFNESNIFDYEESLETIKEKYSKPCLVCRATQCTAGDTLTDPDISAHILNTSYPFQNSPVRKARLISRKKLTSDDAKKQKFAVMFEIEGDFECQPGDSIYFICPNSDKEITWLLERLGYCSSSMHDLHTFNFTSTNKRPPNTAHVPTVASLHQIYQHCLDIRRIFSKELMRYLASCCSVAEEAKMLAWLTEKENSTEFERSILEPRLSLLDILHAFPSCKPSAVTLIAVGVLLPIPGLLPRLLPRPLSIASNTIDAHGGYTFLYSLIEIPSGCGRFYHRQGICTGFLNSLVLDSLIYVYWKKPSNFRLTFDDHNPKLLIGPGVGVAPFVSYLENLEISGRKSLATWLFFGCRNKDRDFILKEKFEKWVEKGVIYRFLVSFSEEDIKEKYVQHNILKYGEEIARIMEQNQNLSIYVCGDAKNMIKDVRATFERILQEFSGLSEEDAKKRLKKMKNENLYVEEAWI